MQQVVILASSLWTKPSKRERENLEKTYLKLANYILSEKVAGREIKATWFCFTSMTINIISEFNTDYNVAIEFVTHTPSRSLIEIIEREQEIITEYDLKLNEQETRKHSFQKLEDDFWSDFLPDKIEEYISEHYPNALEIMPPSALGGLPVWFAANFSHKGPSYLEESGLLDSYIELFPTIFRSNALSLLTTCFDGIEIDKPWGVVNEYKVQLLCFAKLLHGFVCASDYDSNDFSVTETVDSLGINDLYLGGLLSTDMFKELSDSDYEAEDNHELRIDFLEGIAREQVCALVTTLTKRFGVTELCAMLWWCIYPNYTQSAYDKFDALFNGMGFDFPLELMQVYNLLEDGWSDYADNN